MEELTIEERYEIITALLPKGFETEIQEDDTLLISDGEKEVELISYPNEKQYVIDGKTLHYEVEDETVNTILIPFILSVFDGQARL